MSYRAVFYDSVTGNPIWVDIDPATLPVTASSGRSMVKAQVSTGPPIQPPSTTGPQWSMGYWNSVVITSPFQPPSTIDWGGLTHVIHQVATVNADGTLNPNLTSQGIAADVAQLKAAAGSVKILLGLAQGDYTGAVSHLSTFVANIMALVNQYGYDGVDLDWEPNPNVAQLGAQLRSAL
ncbi:MAG: glycosyl hydrolase family 18 protein, partial [Pseudomonadota bacterium]